MTLGHCRGASGRGLPESSPRPMEYSNDHDRCARACEPGCFFRPPSLATQPWVMALEGKRHEAQRSPLATPSLSGEVEAAPPAPRPSLP